MQVKTFSARGMSAVLGMIREELGPDAVILDTQEENGTITVTAALEGASAKQRQPDGTPESKPSPSAASHGGAPPQAANRGKPQESASAEGHAAPPPPFGWQKWHEEWSSIKNHLLALMKPALKLDLLPPRQRLAIEYLQREGVEDSAVLELFQRLQNDPDASILAPLADMVPLRPWGEHTWPQRIQVIAGPFGAGKTSVAIRMALALRRLSPACRVCLVNADATRGNGRLLLRHYCDLSDMAYKEASSTMELVSALNTAKKEGFDKIVVDLPGLSKGRYLSTLLADAGLGELTGETANDVAVHLTLPPHYGSTQLGGILERYRTPHAGGIVWTKLDEADHYGQIINVALETCLPVSALSFGPGLGNSLAPVREPMLWKLLFKRELPIVL
ncbi:MAG: flagellar biosynthesis protein FlhF [Desulfovibrio sp.]|jgi:flagellar biosynthesis protein FlhF|nr:flagellar biosynthesis protein FlhF [Desulfovibrio sp.]